MNKNGILYRICRKCYHIVHNIFYPFGYIRNYIIFPIKAFLRTKGIICKKQNAAIKEVKDIHKGKRCFVLATGPSLKVEDVEALEEEITIAVNSFYKIYEKTEFRPTYYAVLDPDVQSTVIANSTVPLNELSKSKVFMNDMQRDKIDGIVYLPLCYQDHWFNVFNEKYNFEQNLRKTTDLLWGIYDKYTITNAAIEIAIYMGCTEIYLLGVDCNYNGPQNYFAKPDKGTFTPNEFQASMTQKAMMTGYRFMERETRKQGIRVFNATRGGMLEEFERVNFDDLKLGGNDNDNAE